MTQDDQCPDVYILRPHYEVLIMYLVEIFLLLLPWTLSFSLSLLVFPLPDEKI